MPDYYIGVMTGTSLDAIDIALVDFDNKPTLVSSTSHKLPLGLKTKLAVISQPNADITSLIQIKSLEQEYTQVLALAIAAFLETAGVKPCAKLIRAIGVHGVTICHEPTLESPFTWQIIDAHRLAVMTGISVVYDFRSKDIALGGQGAPLVPMFHYDIFQELGHDFSVLNLGGIANVSTWPNKDEVIGFDTGPANTLLDYWINKSKGLSYDSGGSWAAKGKCSESLLVILLDELYFSQPFPKSTGKELFSEAWLNRKLTEHERSHGAIDTVDVQNTLTHLTAKTVQLAMQQLGGSKTLAVCGGGVHNQVLMTLLATYLPDTNVISTADLGICPDNMEAMAFAWLAKCRLENKTTTLPSITGTQRPTVLGAWVLP